MNKQNLGCFLVSHQRSKRQTNHLCGGLRGCAFAQSFFDKAHPLGEGVSKIVSGPTKTNFKSFPHELFAMRLIYGKKSIGLLWMFEGSNPVVVAQLTT